MPSRLDFKFRHIRLHDIADIKSWLIPMRHIIIRRSRIDPLPAYQRRSIRHNPGRASAVRRHLNLIAAAIGAGHLAANIDFIARIKCHVRFPDK